MEVVFGILVFVAVVGITLVVFSGWLIVSVARLATRGITLLFGLDDGRRPPVLSATSPDKVRCARARCHAENPTGAKFCRRCGREMTAPQQVQVRRAALA